MLTSNSTHIYYGLTLPLSSTVLHTDFLISGIGPDFREVMKGPPSVLQIYLLQIQPGFFFLMPYSECLLEILSNPMTSTTIYLLLTSQTMFLALQRKLVKKDVFQMKPVYLVYW